MHTNNSNNEILHTIKYLKNNTTRETNIINLIIKKKHNRKRITFFFKEKETDQGENERV